MQGRDNQVGRDRIRQLLEAVDAYLPVPARENDKPVYLPVEGVHNITGCAHCAGRVLRTHRAILFLLYFDYTSLAFQLCRRGTVVTGRLERGTLRRGDDIEIKGYDKVTKSSVSSAHLLTCSASIFVITVHVRVPRIYEFFIQPTTLLNYKYTYILYEYILIYESR